MATAASLACATTDNVQELKQFNGTIGNEFETRRLSNSDRVLEVPCRRMIEISGILTEHTDSPLMVLDNACGSSALATSVLFDALPCDRAKLVQVVAADVSESAVRGATEVVDEYWPERVMTLTMNMETMDGLCDAEFTHVITNFGVALAKDTQSSLKEMMRILRPGGTCAFTTWSSLSWISILRGAIASIPDAPLLPHQREVLLFLSNQKPWHDADFVQQQIDQAGFIDVHMEEFTATHDFTKQEFIDTFGGAVVRYLCRRIFGKERSQAILDRIPDAMRTYLDSRYSDDRITIETKSLIVVCRKKGTFRPPCPKRMSSLRSTDGSK